MLPCLERHAQLCAVRQQRYHMCGDSLFRVFDRVARPIGPIVQDHTLTAAQAAQVRRALGAALVWWTDGPADAATSGWYAVTCDRFTPLEQMPSKHRCEVRRGQKNCTVRQLDAAFVCQHGYPVYEKSFARYRGRAVTLWDEPAFRRFVELSRDFGDITHYWGAFVGEQLVALAANDIYDKVEATYWMIKADPEHLKAYPIYALIYAMNEFYLGQQGFQYVNDGWRALVHESHVQAFLTAKFGFAHRYRRLQINFHPALKLLLGLTAPLAGRLARLDRRLAALYALQSCRRGSVAVAACPNTTSGRMGAAPSE
jgi:hypothetical protein